jgi:hypothetical protein
MERKIQLGLLITSMVLVGVSRFVATASASGQTVVSPVHQGGTGLPPDVAR